MVNLTLKDLFHEKGRFFLVVLGLTVSMMMVTFGMGFINGSLEENTRFNNEFPQYDDNEGFQSIYILNKSNYLFLKLLSLILVELLLKCFS